MTGSRLFQAQHLTVSHQKLDEQTDTQLARVAQRVDMEFHSQWKRDQVQVAAVAPNLTLVRRISLALTGTLPSLEEMRELEKLPADQQVSWWTERLLNDKRFSDYVAERLARAFVGTEAGPFLFFRRRRFVMWISEHLDKRTRYDEVVRQMIGHEGVWTTDPAVNFVTVTATENTKNQPDPIRLAGRTARAFLGMRIDCLQCHDDHLGNISFGSTGQQRTGKQQDFHRLAAFFAKTKTSILGIQDAEGEYRYRFLNQKNQEVVPAQTPFLGELLEETGTDRQRLANWVTHRQNTAFARATVNRVWAIVFGTPLIEPVDNIPLHGPFPPGLEILATDFIEHDYDLRRLFRVILKSRPFRVDSRALFEITDKHEEAWSVFRLTRLRGEQVAGSLIQACSIRVIDANSHVLSKLARYFREVEFVKRFGDQGENEFEDRGGTIRQRLLMMNGDLVKKLTKQDLVGNASTRISVLAADDKRAVDTAYLCVLSRHPSEREMAHFTKRLAGLQGDKRNQMLEDLFWVLLNSTEFSWNH